MFWILISLILGAGGTLLQIRFDEGPDICTSAELGDTSGKGEFVHVTIEGGVVTTGGIDVAPHCYPEEVRGLDVLACDFDNYPQVTFPDNFTFVEVVRFGSTEGNASVSTVVYCENY